MQIAHSIAAAESASLLPNGQLSNDSSEPSVQHMDGLSPKKVSMASKPAINVVESWSVRRRRTFQQQLFRMLLLFAVIARITWFIVMLVTNGRLWPFYQSKHEENSGSTTFRPTVTVTDGDEEGFDVAVNVLHHLFPDLISLFFYYTYLAIVFSWGKLYFRALSLTGRMRTRLHSKILTAFWLIIGGITAFVVTFGLICHFVLNPRVYMITIVYVLFPVLGIGTAVGFIIFGTRLQYELKKLLDTNISFRERQLKKVGLLGAICTLSFSLRAICVLIISFLFHDPYTEYKAAQYQGLVYLVFFICFELLPSSVVLIGLDPRFLSKS